MNTPITAFVGRRSKLAVGLTLALVLAACGGDDTPVAAPNDSQPETVASTEATEPTEPTEPTEATGTAAAGSMDDGPVSTLSPDIPSEFLEGIGPVDVIGEPLPVQPDGGDDPAIGMDAPTLVGYDLDGNPIRIDPSTDAPMMIVFLAHWCSHCNAEVPRLNELRDADRFPEDLEIVAVATGSRPDAPNWPPTVWLEDTMDWTYPAMLDGIDMEVGSFIAYDAYGVAGFPTVVLVDADGKVAYRWSGEREPDEVIAYLDEYLDLG